MQLLLEFAHLSGVMLTFFTDDCLSCSFLDLVEGGLQKLHLGELWAQPVHKLDASFFQNAM